MKRYIWGFPGIGKSGLRVSGLRVVDADCKTFEFKNVTTEDLHGAGEFKNFERDETYPQNYLDYIKSVDADVVLINCHLKLLERLDKDDILVVYPCRWLMFEYIERYVQRGDNSSFIAYMENEAPGIIECIDGLDYEKYKVYSFNTYLNDLFERKEFKMKLMTRSELVEQLQRAKDLDLLGLDERKNALLCDMKFKINNDSSVYGFSAESLADDVFHGKYSLDIDQLKDTCEIVETLIKEENTKRERRGGLSCEELEDKIMQGIVNGALGIRYSEISPYSHGYEVTFGGDGEKGSTWKFKNRWECYCGFFEIPGRIANMIENGHQSGRVYGDKAQPLDIKEMLTVIDEMEDKQISAFVPAKESGLERRGYHAGHVASVMDVHKGIAFDGIVQHFYHGDYSSMTPVNQNNLVETLVFMKGFCLDCLNRLDIGADGRQKVVDYLRLHGTDISTPEKLHAWIKANPEKCGKEENRKLSLDVQISKSAALSKEPQNKSHKSFERDDF